MMGEVVLVALNRDVLVSTQAGKRTSNPVRPNFAVNSLRK
jgi:hypothetical protein